MARWQTIILVKIITVWNYLTSLYSNISERVTNFSYYLKDYFNGHHDTWFFVPGHTFPLSLANISNSIHVNWVYNNTDTSLTLATTNATQYYKFSWLSAKIKVKYNDSAPVEFIIDNFLEQFVVRAIDSSPPSLYLVFMSWCAHTKHWFNVNNNIEIHIIDDMGEEHILTFKDHNNALIIKRNKIYLSDVTEITVSPQNEVTISNTNG